MSTRVDLARAVAPMLALALLLALATPIAWGQDDLAPPGSAQRGREIYLELRCQSCHGTVGQGSGASSGGPKLLPDLFPWGAFLQQMRRPRLDMPAYLPQWVSDQDIADMYAYLAQLRDRPAPKRVPAPPVSASRGASATPPSTPIRAD